MRKLRRWMQLSWRERGVLVRAVLHLLMARYRGASVERRASARRTIDGGLKPAAPQLLAWAVYTAARNVPFATTCLDRAVALFRMLRAEGLEAELRIGVRTEEGALAAHAWVEHHGAVLLDEEASRFVAFDAPVLTSR